MESSFRGSSTNQERISSVHNMADHYATETLWQDSRAPTKETMDYVACL